MNAWTNVSTPLRNWTAWGMRDVSDLPLLTEAMLKRG